MTARVPDPPVLKKKAEMDDFDYQRFYGDEGIWMNDEHPEEDRNSFVITASTFHRCHADLEVCTKGRYHYDVLHVRGFHGKGFMPRLIHNLIGHSGNGDIFYGTDQKAYEKAKTQGS